PAVTLFVDRRLIGAARLQVVGANEVHVAFFRFLLRRDASSRKHRQRDDERKRPAGGGETHGRPPLIDSRRSTVDGQLVVATSKSPCTRPRPIPSTRCSWRDPSAPCR